MPDTVVHHSSVHQSILLGITVLLGKWREYGGDSKWWRDRLKSRIN